MKFTLSEDPRPARKRLVPLLFFAVAGMSVAASGFAGAAQEEGKRRKKRRPRSRNRLARLTPFFRRTRS